MPKSVGGQLGIREQFDRWTWKHGLHTRPLRSAAAMAGASFLGSMALIGLARDIASDFKDAAELRVTEGPCKGAEVRTDNAGIHVTNVPADCKVWAAAAKP